MPPQINSEALAAKHGGVSEVRKVDYGKTAQKHGGIVIPSVPHESSSAVIPPQLQRIEHAVQPQFEQGPTFRIPATGQWSEASVDAHEPHKIVIRLKDDWNKGPLQTRGHELIHLLQNQLPGPLQKQIPPDDPHHPYDISNVDQLRAKGLKLWQLPHEQAATIVQRWIADPASRSRLQPWMDDLVSVPLSIIEPTSPDAKTINMHPRPPVPPVDAFRSEISPAIIDKMVVKDKMVAKFLPLHPLLYEAKLRDPRRQK